MDGIGNALDGNSILLNKMQSDAAIKKVGAGSTEKSSENLGNILNSFGDILKGQMNNINNLQNQADDAMQTYAVGGDIELHQVVLAADKADMALQLAMQVRNKAIAAYQELTHMNI